MIVNFPRENSYKDSKKHNEKYLVLAPRVTLNPNKKITRGVYRANSNRPI